jgi:hypothetical protein
MSLGIVFFTAVANATVRHHTGRTYVADGNGRVKIPFGDADVFHGQGQRLMISGLTVDRPVPDGNRVSWPPAQFYDETLAKPIFYVAGSNPARWVDITGASV